MIGTTNQWVLTGPPSRPLGSLQEGGLRSPSGTSLQTEGKLMRQRDTRPPPVHPTVRLSSNKPPVGGTLPHCSPARLGWGCPRQHPSLPGPHTPREKPEIKPTRVIKSLTPESKKVPGPVSGSHCHHPVLGRSSLQVRTVTAASTCGRYALRWALSPAGG